MTQTATSVSLEIPATTLEITGERLTIVSGGVDVTAGVNLTGAVGIQGNVGIEGDVAVEGNIDEGRQAR